MATNIDRTNGLLPNLVTGELNYILSGTLYTTATTAASSLVGGITGTFIGACTNSKDPINGAIEGGKAGLCWGAGAGFIVGAYKSAPYTFKLCKEYTDSCKALQKANESADCCRQITEKTKEVIHRFLYQFCQENDEGERQQICCSVTREIMLYPANLTTCARPHFYELATLHELLKRGNGHANCSICRVAFQAKDIEINTNAHDRLEEVVNQAFAYLLLSIQDPDHLILQNELEKNRERLMSHLWSQTFNPLPTLLSDDVAQRIRRKEPLPIDVVWTLYPAFSQVCAQFLQDSKIMLEGFINDLEAQGEIKTNSEGQDSAEITQEQHGKRLIQIMRLKNKNDEIFNFAATIKTKN